MPHRAGEEWLFHGKLVFSGAVEMGKNTLQMPGFGAILAHLPSKGSWSLLKDGWREKQSFQPTGNLGVLVFNSCRNSCRETWLSSSCSGGPTVAAGAAGQVNGQKAPVVPARL